MGVHLEITDRTGSSEQTVDVDRFWIGSLKSDCEVQADLPGVHGRVLEVSVDGRGRLQVRAESGLPFPVRCATGNVSSRFEALLDGDTVNVGPALVRLRYVPEPGEEQSQELDPSTLAVAAPGAPVGSWYRTFMEMADNLEGLKTPERMIDAAMLAILKSSSVERVHVQLDPEYAAGGKDAFFLSRGEERRPFRVSRSLVNQVHDSGRVVHVPVAAADPVASRFQSVRSEGISASIALPVHALGKTMGVIYADCVRDGAVLTAEDLQRVAFMTRMLASALGNRTLVSGLLRADVQSGTAPHWALETQSASCTDMVDRVKLYAQADYTVLLRGATGTGKEVIAKALHEMSRRAKGPFVPVNCAAIPEQLMESMLFGHEKGSFTGAAQARRGHFEEAHGGTILLDEIGDMALELQAKILRVLQDRIVTPIGSRRQIRVDVRILAATHQDLEQMVRGGAFRNDLYYRLRELEIHLPALRERIADLPLLCHRFLEEAAEELGYSEVPAIAEETVAILRDSPWPGNIRELRHVIKAAALRAAGGAIRPAHLELRSIEVEHRDLDGSGAGSTWKERLEAQERLALERSLSEADGNLTRAAELFGVPRTTYREKLVRHGLLPS